MIQVAHEHEQQKDKRGYLLEIRLSHDEGDYRTCLLPFLAALRQVAMQVAG
jgi:hypothetical protein